MLIPITLQAPSVTNPKLPPCLAKISHDEVVLIELQGSLEIESNHPSERDGKFVGKLRIDETNKPTLVIGHHLLEGKIQTLTKPLAVLVRARSPIIARQASTSFHSSSKTRTLEEDEAMVIDEDDDNNNHNNRSGDEGDDDDAVPSPTNALKEQEGIKLDAAGGGLEQPGATWTIAGLVKKKIIFSKRPMPTAGNKSMTLYISDS